MVFMLRDLGALATARRTGTSMADVRSVAASAAKDVVPGPPDIATTLDALRAVLPATFISLYSGAVILLQNAAQAAGAGPRAEAQAALAQRLTGSPAELQAALASMPVEPDTFVWLRVGFAALCLLLLAFQAYRTAQVPGKPRVVLEPLVTTGVFAAWALASPGTFLAAFLKASDLAAWTIVIAFGTSIALWVLATTVLKKKRS